MGIRWHPGRGSRHFICGLPTQTRGTPITLAGGYCSDRLLLPLPPALGKLGLASPPVEEFGIASAGGGGRNNLCDRQSLQPLVYRRFLRHSFPTQTANSPFLLHFILPELVAAGFILAVAVTKWFVVRFPASAFDSIYRPIRSEFTAGQSSGCQTSDSRFGNSFVGICCSCSF